MIIPFQSNFGINSNVHIQIGQKLQALENFEKAIAKPNYEGKCELLEEDYEVLMACSPAISRPIEKIRVMLTLTGKDKQLDKDKELDDYPPRSTR